MTCAREDLRARTHFSTVEQRIHTDKTKLLRINTANNGPIMRVGNGMDDVQAFTYLGSFVNNRGGNDAHVKARIGKARQD